MGKKAAELRALLDSRQLAAVDEFLAEYEADVTEEAITGSEHEAARHKVRATREIRALLKPRRRGEGQAQATGQVD